MLTNLLCHTKLCFYFFLNSVTPLEYTIYKIASYNVLNFCFIVDGRHNWGPGPWAGWAANITVNFVHHGQGSMTTSVVLILSSMGNLTYLRRKVHPIVSFCWRMNIETTAHCWPPTNQNKHNTADLCLIGWGKKMLFTYRRIKFSICFIGWIETKSPFLLVGFIHWRYNKEYLDISLVAI